jgi:regulator of protease activity HflC (stomatin/prohibitin superfamily)
MADLIASYLLLAVVIVFAWLVLFRRVTVYQYQRGLKYTKGRYVSTLGPGQHWVFRLTSVVQLIDARRRFATISGQDVLSADGVPVKVSLAASYSVADPAKAVNEIENYESALYLRLQIALRSVMAGVAMEGLVEKRAEIGSELASAAAAPVEELGLKLLSVDVKDIMLSGEVKRLFTDVVKARKQGQAALELARGETAALRSLANIAGVLESHPALLQLRAVQQLVGSEGNTLVLGLPQDSHILPGSGRAKGQAEETEGQ